MNPVKGAKFVTAFVAAFLLSTVFAGAQFRDEAFSQQYNSDPADKVDTTDVLFSLKDYIGGLKHQKEIKMGTMAMGSAVLIGGCQIYNRQYWKLPIVYGTIGGSLGAGIYLNTQGRHDAANGASSERGSHTGGP